MKKLSYLFVLAVLIISCKTEMKENGNDSSTSGMNAEKMQRFYDEIFNAHSVAMLDSFVTDDVIDHQASPTQGKGKEGLRAAFTDFFTGYPDIHVKTNFIVAKGDTVFAHFTMTGTNSGASMGMPATNKQINVDGIDCVIIKDGKATEHWGYSEEMKMMGQLGMNPGAAAAPADSAMMKK